jgi:hypothetical protein
MSVSIQALENLARIGQLKKESFDCPEFERLLGMAQARLEDAMLPQLSSEGRFISAYSAAHAASLAALRWYGYRSENRYTVFQCLEHTVQWPPHLWRVLDVAHQKRNLAEYEGFIDVSEDAIAELCELIPLLISATRLLAKD